MVELIINRDEVEIEELRIENLELRSKIAGLTRKNQELLTRIKRLRCFIDTCKHTCMKTLHDTIDWADE